MKSTKLISTIGILLITAISGFSEKPAPRAVDSASKPDATAPRVAENYGKIPMHFEANEGQFDDQVKFMSRGPGYSLFLTPTEAVLTLAKTSEEAGNHVGRRSLIKQDEGILNPRSAVLRMKLIGANAHPRLAAVDEQPGKVNYFIGNDSTKWRSNIATHSKVKYENVYSGVDLVFYGNQRQLEYDLVLAPGADTKAITLRFEGADKIEVDAQGDLIMHIRDRLIRQLKPLIYQQAKGVKQKISGDYVVKGPKQVGFELAAYDHSKPLIIDPVLVYSTYLGGNNGDFGNGIAVDPLGNAYVTGYTFSGNFPTTAGGFQITSSGNPDAFVAKLNSTGTGLIYSTYLGGNSADVGYAIAVDALGNAYVTGWTESGNFPTTAGAVQNSVGGSADLFVAKLNSTGTGLIYSTYLGGSRSDFGQGIAIDSSGNAYVTGYTLSRNFPTTAGALSTTAGGGFTDAFVAKLNAAGTGLIYSTYIGGNSQKIPYGIALDPLGNAYLTGNTADGILPTTAGAFQTAPGGDYDAFATKLNSTGTGLIYSTYLGGNRNDYGYGIAVDPFGNAYVTGFTGSGNFPTTAGAFQTLSGGDLDAFVTKLNPTGTGLIYSTFVGGNNSDIGRGIAVDSLGNVHITGDTRSGNLPTTIDAFQTTSGGNADAFVAKLNSTGTGLMYSTYIGGDNDDISFGIALDSLSNVYVTGYTFSGNFPTTAGALQTTSGGASDAFVARIAEVPPNEPPTVTCPPSSSAECSGTQVTLTAHVDDPNGDTLTVQWEVDGTLVETHENVPADSDDSFTANYPLGTHAITVTVKDAADSSSTCMTTFTVSDATPPVITSCAPAQSANANANCQAAVPDFTSGIVANDCNGPVTVTQSPAAGTLVGLGPHTITLTVKDAANNASTCTTTFTVNDTAAPLITACAPAQSASANASCQAAVPDFTGGVVASDCNGPLTVTQSPTEGTLVGLGPHTITLTVKDAAGNAATCQAMFSVIDGTSPVVSVISAPLVPVSVNALVSTSASFADNCGPHTAVWDWGDGQTSSGVITEANGSGTVTGTHAYTQAGVYTVTLTVTDQAGNSGQSVFQFVVVYDPDGGFVTGGGWINSMAGAYFTNPSLVGKATFGFVSKYLKGATVPTGDTEFQFKVANLNFKSTVYQWLVVAGAKAQYKGAGTINGSGDFGFMLTAIDGQINGGGGTDKFRIKIWDKASGQIVYDNQITAGDTADPTTLLGGGSFVIHKE